MIFATTTPVADKKAKFEGPFPPAHYNENIIKYNREVVELILNEYENVLINDLHSELYEIRDKAISSEDLIHPSEYGVEILAKAVVGNSLILKAGYTLRDNNRGIAYQMLLNMFYMNDIETCNMVLKSMGLSPLAKEDY